MAPPFGQRGGQPLSAPGRADGWVDFLRIGLRVLRLVLR